MPYKQTTKTRQKTEAMRQRLVAAARTLFLEQGYEATTLQQVVKEANTSIGNCYFYFSNKEALLLTVAEQFRSEIAGEVDAAIASLPLGPNLLAVAVYTGVMAVLRQPNVARLAFYETALPSLRSAAVELFTSRIERIVDKMPMDFGENASPLLIAYAWQGPLQSVIEGVVAGRIHDEPDRIARFLVCWNLRALGLPEKVIQIALESLRVV